MYGLPWARSWCRESRLIVINRVLSESWRITTLDRVGNPRFYMWAVLLPPALVLAAVCLSIVSGAARFDLSIDALSALPWAIASQAPMVAFFALGEEVGWRGFLLPRLILAGLGEYQALAMTGLIWGLWHAPIILRGYNYPGHPYLGVTMMTVFCTLIGTVFGWLRLASTSVWPAAAAHAAINLTLVQLASPFLAAGYDRTIAGLLTSVIGWIPLIAICAWLIWTRRLPALRGDSVGSASAMAMGLR